MPRGDPDPHGAPQAGASALELAFTKKADECDDEDGEESGAGKTGCEWRLERAEIVPAAAGAGKDGGR